MSGRAISWCSAIAAALVIIGIAAWILVSSGKLLEQAQVEELAATEQTKSDEPVSASKSRTDKSPVVEKGQVEKLVLADINFAFNLFSEIVKQKTDENVFISPFSIAVALQMTYNGAAGETAQAMAKALNLEGASLDEVNQQNLLLNAALQSPDPKVELNIANSLWAKEGVAFKQAFIKRNRNFYDAEVSTLNFSDPSAAKTINSWVSNKTKEKIREIVQPPIDPATILFLINAVYFKGQWTKEFDKSKTKEREFTMLDGKKKMWPMMHQKGNYRYLRGDDFQAVSLPYGKNRRLSMYVFLPDKFDGIKDFYKRLTSDNWQDWMQHFGVREGTVVLPRFKLELEYEKELKKALTELGMGIAFSEARADFNNMCYIPVGLNVYIGRVKHKTFVEVNEEGTEAAAATSVEMMMTSARAEPIRPFEMVVDHPFFFAIVDNQTKAILFMGSVLEPR